MVFSQLIEEILYQHILSLQREYDRNYSKLGPTFYDE